jgi:cardiolipin synthase
VYGLQKAFLVDWYFVDRSLIGGQKYYPIIEPTQTNSCIAQVVTSSPIAEWPDIMQGYVRILLEARKYVFIETPYFLPTEPVLFAMRTAALAGVDVRLLVPMHPDTRLAKWASHSYMTETIKSGIKVYFYKPGFNHSKLLICDDSLCTCGSTNVDFRSFENNFESNIFFYDEQTALRMKQVSLDDLANSVLMNGQLRVDRRPFMVRLWESLIRLLAPLL